MRDKRFASLHGISGNELVYVCSVCQKPKLYLNQDTKAWHCFVCGDSGRARHQPNVIEAERPKWGAPVEVPGTPVLDSVFGMKLLADRGIKHRQFVEALHNWSRLRYNVSHGLILDLWANQSVVGSVSYLPGREPKYRTLGERGVHAVRLSDTINTPATVYLFEGFFDFLSTAQYALMSTNFSGDLVYSAGNTLSKIAKEELCRVYPNTTKVVICFDTDKEEPQLKVRDELLPHFDLVAIADFGEEKRWKDWDEAMQTPEGRLSWDMLTAAMEGL